MRKLRGGMGYMPSNNCNTLAVIVAVRRTVSSQNVPLSKRPTVKTSHIQNVPSQNVPFLKQNVPVGQNVPSQNVPMLMN